MSSYNNNIKPNKIENKVIITMTKQEQNFYLTNNSKETPFLGSSAIYIVDVIKTLQPILSVDSCQIVHNPTKGWVRSPGSGINNISAKHKLCYAVIAT